MAHTTRGFPVPPPVLGLAAALAQRALVPRPRPSAPRRAVAVAVAAASAGLAGSAAGGFRRRGTTVNPIRLGESTELVVDGPFAHTRNPMYVGMAGVLTAHAVWRGRPAAALPLLAWVAVIDNLQIPPEEASMAELFGDRYASYRSTVPRWVGPVR
ncbi:isoprenylcysteine carboxylmethyltransferase family protein [Nocardioides sp. HDW12B]|uniref:methyltransferase family protein n=1 Tax=Nocardioides sp. HDW12B TaxID=2714939 RepID=UPI0014079B06|nr:isoprenylcysteine carboxylmethyltransferase family protein [Nocardioides sp. HDW12B]QIK67466.1 isoprenylcysteine carboxylmethyltransferase family protein [Nocardioides sp. HDW12B]